MSRSVVAALVEEKKYTCKLPSAGNCRVIAFASSCPAEKFNDDVVGTPVAPPGRKLMNPAAEGCTAVTLIATPVAPVGTTIEVPADVGMEPVICTRTGCAATSGTGTPSPTRVSTMRTGVIATKLEGALSAAEAMNNPPAPSATATAAPIAAHLERHRPCLEP
jgi:hypothetical protein